jgi:hypothetical protein
MPTRDRSHSPSNPTHCSTASVPPKPREARNADLPPNLYEDRGYYRYRDPRSGESHPVASNITDPAARRAEAIRQAIEVNQYLQRPATLIERVGGNASVISHQSSRSSAARTLAAFVPTYRARLEERELAKNTLYGRKRQLDIIERQLGHIAIGAGQADAADITRQLADWLRAESQTGRRRMAQAYRSTLADLFAEMAAAGWIAVNPVDVLRLPAPKIRRQRLTLDDFLRIYEAAAQLEPWVRRSMELGIVTLQRREDVSRMGFRDELDTRLQVVQQKTGARIRIPTRIRLDAVGWTLDDIIKRCRDDVVSRHLVHHTRNQGQAEAGKPVHPQTITTAFRQARTLAGIQTEPGKTPPTYHELRSLGARLYLRQAYNPQDLLGHKKEETTAIYTDNRGAEWIDVAAA